MFVTESRLTLEEIKMVFRNEYTLRTYYQVQGELEDSSRIIQSLKARISLACGNHEAARQFFALLEADSQQIDFTQIYQAGKDCFKTGVPFDKGLYNCTRELALKPTSQRLSGELQRCFMELTALMPDEETRMYPEYLLTEYRATYGAVNRHIGDFFKLGYEAGKQISESGQTASAP